MSIFEVLGLIILIALMALVFGEALLVGRPLEQLVDWLYGRHTKKWFVQTDPGKVIEQIAEVRKDFETSDPEKPPVGKVFVRGELWAAVANDSSTSFKKGDRVRIVERAGHTLIVEGEDSLP